MENLIYDVFTALDPSGTNTANYQDLFKPMSDVQFESFFKSLFANESEFLTLDIIDYEIDVTIEDIEKAADILDVPLMEHVAMPYVNMNNDSPVVSKEPAFVGYLHLKRMQQTLSKKNSTSTDIGERSALTGQVTGRDKNARDSDSENFAFVTLDATANLQEFLGPRADDMVMKNELYSDIKRKGYGSLTGLTNDLSNKATLNTLNALMIGMGLKSDLVTPDLVLNKTLNTK